MGRGGRRSFGSELAHGERNELQNVQEDEGIVATEGEM